MAILNPTAILGRVTCLGIVRDRSTSPRSTRVDTLEMRFGGIVGESHFGLVRPSCSRVTAQYEKGTPIRNTRQISILSEEELAATAESMGLPGLDPAWVGANVVFAGIPALTLLPPGARLIFEGGVSVTVDMENAPCQIPAREIDRAHPGKGARYRSAARHRRGVTAWVEREGTVAIGEQARLHVPPQRLYPPLAELSGG